MLSLLSRHRLDIRFRHFSYALLASVWARNPDRLSSRVETIWSPDGGGLACRSVRSGFHLLLEALALPRGTEVLVSAVTHPDMIRILEAHGLVAVPVDLDPATFAPRVDRAEQLVTPRAAVFLVAHLFGGRMDIAPVAAFTRRHGLLLWEDCAQAFTGPGDIGDPRADVSMYSFGALKTCTALGGALLNVRDRGLLRRMRTMQGKWQLQRRRAYAVAVLKFFAFSLITRPIPYGLLALAFWAALRPPCQRLGPRVPSRLVAAAAGAATVSAPARNARIPAAHLRPRTPSTASAGRRVARRAPSG